MFLIALKQLKRHFTFENINKRVQFICFFFWFNDLRLYKNKKKQVKSFVFGRWLVVFAFTAIRSFYQRNRIHWQTLEQSFDFGFEWVEPQMLRHCTSWLALVVNGNCNLETAVVPKTTANKVQRNDLMNRFWTRSNRNPTEIQNNLYSRGPLLTLTVRYRAYCFRRLGKERATSISGESDGSVCSRGRFFLFYPIAETARATMRVSAQAFRTARRSSRHHRSRR